MRLCFCDFSDEFVRSECVRSSPSLAETVDRYDYCVLTARLAMGLEGAHARYRLGVCCSPEQGR